MASTIELQSDGAMPAYVAEPSGKPLAGVVVVQEIFGVSQPMKNVAELLASEGYLAIVPALYHRVDANFVAEPDEAGIKRGLGARDKSTIADVTSDLAASAAYLRGRLGADAKIGVWGFCFGGTIAYFAATLPFVDASVAFYGGAIATKSIPELPAMVDLTSAIHAPIFLAFGAEDHGIPSDAVASIRAALETSHKDFALKIYPDAGHGFFRAGPTSSPAASEAWTTVKAFLAKNLGRSRA